MVKKLTREDFRELAKTRQHSLISVENEGTPSKGKIVIFCNVCGTEFSIDASKYKRAKTSACPICNQQKPNVQKRSSSAITKSDEKIKQNYDFITNSSDFRTYLLGENNVYTRFLLEKLDHPIEKSENTQIHHMIPKHANGPDSKWNRITLTKADHIKAHKLRYEVYHEFGDYNYLRTVNANIPLNPEYELRIAQMLKKADETRQEEKTGIYADGVSAKGGRASAAKASKQRDYSHQAHMSVDVRTALYTGSIWLHKETGIRLVVKPQQAITLTELKNLFIEALPDANKDRITLSKAQHHKDVTSAISKVIRRDGRKTAYGWALVQIGLDSKD
uniref:Putative HNH homing endonuclease n=1 Tax=Hafniomonas laevis TaxID=436124 RepID=A0A0S2LNW7_9CHLO|nr:putative HNH homing endonuclease [Hafniomonas laevis]ALO63087.1 putative HNH homing endonuclease [Hafniomonas laevis]